MKSTCAISPSTKLGMKKYRGTYLALTETGTKTVAGTRNGDQQRQPGRATVELLPTQRCASIDELTAGGTDLAPSGDYKRYNWCYDPLQYDVN